MIRFRTRIERDKRPGDKLGWSFILIRAALSAKLNPGVRRSFRVKGRLDEYPITQTSLLPVRGGKFLLPFNASMRKGTGKKAGDFVVVALEVDNRKLPAAPELTECLKFEPDAARFFKKLNTTNQNYFNNWIRNAKTIETKTRRLTRALEALQRKMNFTEMIREDHRIRKARTNAG